MQGCLVLPFICHLLHPSSSPSSSLPFSPSHLLLLLVLSHVPPLLPSIPDFSSPLSFLLPPPFFAPPQTSTPWLSIFTSWPVWAIIIAHCFNNWGFYTLLTSLPTYLKDTQGIDIQSVSGLLLPLPLLFPPFHSPPSSPPPIVLLSHPPPLSFFPLLYPIFPLTCTGRSLVWHSLCSHGSSGCLLGLCHRLLQA